MDRLAALEIFVRVVDTGSFSAVARYQQIGQPAVSKAIVQLEEWLGVSLLMRSTRSLVPTEAGRIFYERAKRTIEEAQEAVLAARRIAEGRRIVVATPAYLQHHGTPTSPGDLVSHQAVIYTPGGGGEPWTSWTFRKATAEVSVVLRGRVKMTAAEGLREAVNSNMG